MESNLEIEVRFLTSLQLARDFPNFPKKEEKKKESIIAFRSRTLFFIEISQLTNTNKHNWKICENSEHMVSFKCFAFTCVICPLEKSNTSSLNSFRMIILFWHRLSLVLLAPTISGMKDCQFFGHSLFKTYEENAQLSNSIPIVAEQAIRYFSPELKSYSIYLNTFFRVPKTPDLGKCLWSDRRCTFWSLRKQMNKIRVNIEPELLLSHRFLDLFTFALISR